MRMKLQTFLTVGILCSSVAAHAQTPIVVNDTFHFVDAISGNSIGVPSGRYVSFGAFTTPGPANGTTGKATQAGVDQNGTPTVYQVPLQAFLFTVGGSFFNSYPLSTATSLQLLDPWQLDFVNPSYAAESAYTPDIVGATVMPFAKSVTISGTGNSPTFTWTVPAGSSVDSSQVFLWDLDHAGGPDLIYVTAVGGTTFQVPSSLSLQANHRYSIQITLVDLRNPVAGAFESNILSQSRSFFDFTLLAGGAPPNVTLPTPCTGTNTTEYCFNTAVVAGQTIFIDPLTATGYEYQTGAGNPNFESVLLPPNIGDGAYELWLWNGTTWVKNAQTIFGGVPYFFAAGGVDRFRIMGIERSAGIDPSSPTAFVTGLTFVSDGDFTGRMAPIVGVDIDIKPGTRPNPIKLSSNGNTPVAVLSSPTFDAASIDSRTVAFAGAPAVKTSIQDVNGDGLPDQVFQFVTSKLLLTPSDSNATLIGNTNTGQRIAGTDSVRIQP